MQPWVQGIGAFQIAGAAVSEITAVIRLNGPDAEGGDSY